MSHSCVDVSFISCIEIIFMQVLYRISEAIGDVESGVGNESSELESSGLCQDRCKLGTAKVLLINVNFWLSSLFSDADSAVSLSLHNKSFLSILCSALHERQVPSASTQSCELKEGHH
jgi:hypothetical protein